MYLANNVVQNRETLGATNTTNQIHGIYWFTIIRKSISNPQGNAYLALRGAYSDATDTPTQNNPFAGYPLDYGFNHKSDQILGKYLIDLEISVDKNTNKQVKHYFANSSIKDEQITYCKVNMQSFIRQLININWGNTEQQIVKIIMHKTNPSYEEQAGQIQTSSFATFNDADGNPINLTPLVYFDLYK